MIISDVLSLVANKNTTLSRRVFVAWRHNLELTFEQSFKGYFMASIPYMIFIFC